MKTTQTTQTTQTTHTTNPRPSSGGSAKSLAVLIVLAAAVALVVIQFSVRQQTAPEEVEVEADGNDSTGTVAFLMEQQWLIQMKLAQVATSRLAPQITSTGRVVPAPQNQAFVAPSVGGIIRGQRLPRLGEQVREGQIIAVLTETPTAAESAQIDVEQIRMEAERRGLAQDRVEAEARIAFAESDLERAERLFEAGAYSERQLERADADEAIARAGLAAIDARLGALNVPVPVRTYELRAPISGAVVSVTKRFGEQVQAGEAILEIVNMDTVWVEVPVFERDLGRLQENPLATFTTPTFPGREFTTGDVIDAGDVIDEDTRAAMFVFELSNLDRSLRIGMQANLRLDAAEEVDTLLVPKEAVLDNEGTSIVYVLLSGEEFERRDVTLGDEYGDMVAIESGLDAGDRVVTQGAYQLKLQELQPANPGEHSHEV
jgi:cobalt-zinc-cadmium efflux system membrane fusion protein